MASPAHPSAPEQVRVLDRLVGSWRFSGDAAGEATFAWLEGGHFLVQRGALEQDGVVHRAVEIIGCEKGFGAGSAADVVTSRAYTDTGDTLDYTYELDGDTLTIWGGPKGSPAFSTATFDADDTRLVGAWQWPGGGYSFVMTRVDQSSPNGAA